MDIQKYEMICKIEAPYPLNYLPCSNDPQHKALGILVGMLIEKGYFDTALTKLHEESFRTTHREAQR